MLADLCAQLRFTASILFGIPFDTRSLDRLVESLREARREFGAVGSDGAALVASPELDEATRREVQLRRFRTQAVRGARETAYYASLFHDLELDPARLRYEEIARVPPTTKQALRANPDEFVRRTARPALRTTTTGTTGRPTGVCFSREELEAYQALGAISLLANNVIGTEDVVQLSTSARATLGNTCFAGACARAGALVYQAGLVDAAHTLGLLLDRQRVPGKRERVSVLNTYPSHLGEVVELGLRLGHRPADFGLRRIVVGGEIVTEGVKARARRLFGEVLFDEGYGMTETWPISGVRCADGHLHFETSQGLIEVLDPESGAPAGPGQPGTVVATPFPPYRQTTILLRYDTQDVVRPLAGPTSCALRHLPATGHLQGKLALSARHEDGWTFPRQVLEALEAVDELPLPARCGFWAAPGGVAVEVVAPQRAALRRALADSLEAYGVPLRALHLVEDRSGLRRPLSLRGDLREAMFRPAPGSAPVLIPPAHAPATPWDRRNPCGTPRGGVNSRDRMMSLLAGFPQPERAAPAAARIAAVPGRSA